jgi:uncharacterized metal-binding protein
MKKNASIPLIYSCSGCSNNAQLANQIAVDLNREKVAEMSCIAGIGGDVIPLIKKARSGQQIVAVDGCQLHCVKQTLARHQLIPALHITLSALNIKKRFNCDFSEDDLTRVKSILLSKIEHL